MYGDNCTSVCTCITANTNTCVPADGSCTCKSGWTGNNCETDINECDIGTANCPGNSQCINNDGYFECKCFDGYFMTGTGNCEGK